MSETNQVGGISVGLGLDLSVLDLAVRDAGRLFDSLQRKINSVSLEGAVKGNPFAGQNKYLTAFGSSLDKAVAQLSTLDNALLRAGNTRPGNGQAQWFAQLESSVEKVSRALEKLDVLKQKAAAPATVMPAPPQYAGAQGLLAKDYLWKNGPAIDKRSPTEVTKLAQDATASLEVYKSTIKEVDIISQNLASKRGDEQESVQTKLTSGIAAADEALRVFEKTLLSLGHAGGDVEKLRDEFASIIPVTRNEAAAADLLAENTEDVRAAFDAVTRAYADYAVAASRVAGAQVTLNDAQRQNIRIATDVATAEKNQNLAVTTEKAKQALADKGNLLQKEKALREAIAAQIVAGQSPDAEAVETLRKANSELAKYRLVYGDLVRQKSQAAATGDAAMVQSFDAQIQALMRDLPKTTATAAELRGEFKKAYLEANGYEKSLGTLKAELASVNGELTFMQKLLKGNKHDASGLASIKAEITALKQRRELLDEEVNHRKRGGITASPEVLELKQRQISADHAHAEQIKQLEDIQKALVLDIRAENNVLTAQQALRENLTKLAALGVAPEQQIVDLLRQQSSAYVELQARAASFRQSFAAKMSVGDLGGAYLDLQAQKQTVNELAAAGRMKELTPDQQRMWATTQGYGKSIAELSLEFGNLNTKLAAYRSVDPAALFGKDSLAARQFVKDLDLLDLQVQEVGAELLALTTGNTTLRDATEISRMTKAFNDQAVSVENLQREYAKLSAVEQQLNLQAATRTASEDALRSKEQALNAVSRDKVALMKQLAAAGAKLNGEQLELYHTEVLGAQTTTTVNKALQALAIEQERLTAGAKFWPAETEGAQRYSVLLADVLLKQKQLELQKLRLASNSTPDQLATAERAVTNAAELKNRTITEEKLNQEYRERTVLLQKLRDLSVKNPGFFNSEAKQLSTNSAFNKELREYIDLLTRAKAAGVALKPTQEASLTQYSKLSQKIEDVKHREAGLGSFDKKRMLWFVQLRMIWSAYNLVSQSLQEVLVFEQQLAIVASTANATSGEYVSLRNAILGVAEATAYSAEEVAKAAVTIVQAGFSARETVQVLGSTSELASATMADLSTTAGLVTTALRAWQIPATRSTEVADAFAAAVNNSKLSMEALATSFNYVTGVTPDLNVSLQETLSMLSILSNMGISPSTGGTSVRALMSSLIQPTEKFEKALRGVGLTIDDVNPEFHTISDVLKTLKKAGFDTSTAFEGLERRAASGIALLVRSAGTFDDMTQAMYETGSAARMAERNMNTIKAQTAQLGDALKETIVIMGEPFSPLIQDTEKLITALLRLTNVIIAPVASGLADLWQFLEMSTMGLKMLAQGASSTRTSLDLLSLAGDRLNDQLISQIHKAQETTLAVYALQDSYARFKKTRFDMSLNATPGNADAIALAKAKADLTALSRANGDKMLNTTQGSRVNQLAAEYEQLLSQGEALKTAGDYEERRNRLTTELKGLTAEVDRNYQTQIGSLTLLASLQNWGAEQTAMKALANDYKTVAAGAKLMTESITRARKQAELAKTGIVDTRGMYSGPSAEKVDELTASYANLQAAAARLTPEQAEAFFERVATLAGTTKEGLEANMVAFKQMSTAFQQSYSDIETVWSNSSATSDRVASRFGFKLASAAWTAIATANTQFRKSEDGPAAMVAAGADDAIAEFGVHAKRLEEALTRAKAEAQKGSSASAEVKAGLASAVKTELDYYASQMELYSGQSLEPSLNSVFAHAFQQAGAAPDVLSSIDGLSTALSSIFGKAMGEQLAMQTASAFDIAFSEAQKRAKRQAARLAELPGTVERDMRLISNNPELGALPGADGKAFADLYGNKFSAVGKKVESEIAAMKAQIAYFKAQSKTYGDAAWEEMSTYSDALDQYYIKQGSNLKALADDTENVQDNALQAATVINRLFNLNLSQGETMKMLKALTSGVAKASAYANKYLKGASAEDRNRFVGMFKGYERKPPAGKGREKAPVSELKTEAYQEQYNLLVAQYKVLQAQRMENSRSLADIRNSVTAKREVLAADIAALNAQKEVVQEAQKNAAAAKAAGNTHKDKKDAQRATKEMVEAQKRRNEIQSKYAQTTDQIAELYATMADIKWENAHIERMIALNDITRQNIELRKYSQAVAEYDNTHLIANAEKLTGLYWLEIEALNAKAELRAKESAYAKQEAIDVGAKFKDTELNRLEGLLSTQLGDAERRRYEVQKKVLESKTMANAIAKADASLLEAEIRTLQQKVQANEADVESAYKLDVLLRAYKNLQEAVTAEMRKQSDLRDDEIADQKKRIEFEKTQRRRNLTFRGKGRDTKEHNESNESLEQQIDQMVSYTRDMLKEKYTEANESAIGDSLDAIVGKFAGFQNGLAQAIATPIANSLTSAITGENEALDELKGKFYELASAREEAFKRGQETGDYSEYENLNAQMAQNIKLQEEQASLWGQIKASFSEYLKAFLVGIVQAITQLMVQLAIQSAITTLSGGTAPIVGMLGSGSPATAFVAGTGGVIPGGMKVNKFASGGVTDSTMFAMLGDNPSKKEIVIPSQNIQKNRVSGYAREQGGESGGGGITIANVITQGDILGILSQAEGQKLIVNTIGKDIAEKGSTFRQVKGVK